MTTILPPLARDSGTHITIVSLIHSSMADVFFFSLWGQLECHFNIWLPHFRVNIFWNLDQFIKFWSWKAHVICKCSQWIFDQDRSGEFFDIRVWIWLGQNGYPYQPIVWYIPFILFYYSTTDPFLEMIWCKLCLHWESWSLITWRWWCVTMRRWWCLVTHWGPPIHHHLCLWSWVQLLPVGHPIRKRKRCVLVWERMDGKHQT